MKFLGVAQWGPEFALTLANSTIKTNDVEGIPNISFNNGTGGITWADTFTDPTQPDGIKRMSSSGLMRGGFTSATEDVGTIATGNIVPLGMIETAFIIKWRNTVLIDSNIDLPIPSASGAESEMASLSRLMSAADSNIGYAYRYYFPAASKAYAYQPTVLAHETLSPKFRAHKWFLPTPGDAQRFRCAMQEYPELFAAALERLGIRYNGYVNTTGEHSDLDRCYKVNLISGDVLGNNQSAWGKNRTISNPNVVPMVAF